MSKRTSPSSHWTRQYRCLERSGLRPAQGEHAGVIGVISL
jgi:hypothetical protein